MPQPGNIANPDEREAWDQINLHLDEATLNVDLAMIKIPVRGEHPQDV
jgi:hypothetical protein